MGVGHAGLGVVRGREESEGNGKEKWSCYESGEGKQLQWGAEIKIEDVRDICRRLLEPESGDWEWE